MPPTATLPLNGKPRKQLSDQLDRLDDIIDVLGDGLNAAAVTAIRDGARHAVKDAIVELLTHPEVLASLHSAVAQSNLPTPPKRSLWTRLKAGVARLRIVVGSVGGWFKDRFRAVASNTAEKLRAVRDRGMAMLAVAHSGGIYLRRLTLTATLVGILTGVVAFVTPHELLAVVGAVSSAVMAAAAQVVYRARNVIRSLIEMSIPSPAVMPA